MSASQGHENTAATARSGSVQSVQRAFLLLEAITDNGGSASISQLAARSHFPPPTIHRLVRTLLDLGYVRQKPNREYALGPRLVRLGDGASNLFDRWATPTLRVLVAALGESANLAILDGDRAMYVAQAPGLHSMRMFTEVGRRVALHCTAVGKAMLAELPPRTVAEILGRTGMPAQTDQTITDPATLGRELARIRSRGYALDEGEQEFGVRCVAVILPGIPARAALSISGPSARITNDLARRAVPLLKDTAETLATDLDLGGGRRG